MHQKTISHDFMGNPNVVKVVCMLGATGTGKSSVANTLSSSEVFKVSSDINSQTAKTEGVMAMIQTEHKDLQTLIIDTPGLGDSEGRDSLHLA